MEDINFDNISNLKFNKKENNEFDDEKILLYSDDNDKIPTIFGNKIQFNDTFKLMLNKLNILSLNASDIINEKKFSCKELFQKYSNIQALKKEEELKKINFISSKDIDKLNLNNNNNNSLQLNKSNSNSMNNLFNLSDLNMNLSKSSINSNKMRNLTENKRKRQESNNNEGRENTKVLFNDILTICQNISNLKNNLIEIRKEQNELINDNENSVNTIVCNNKEIVTIYFNENEVQRIDIIKNNKIFTEEKDIYENLKKIKRELNKILNKFEKNK